MKRSLVFGILTLTLTFTPVIASADFTLTDPGVSGSGSGDSLGTALIANTGPWDVSEPGVDRERTVTPTSGAVAFQESHAEAHDGTAEASTSGTQTDTQSAGDDTVMAVASGSTSATVEKERDPASTQLYNEAIARLLAAGGAGTITGSEYVNTETGFMLADADTSAKSDSNVAPNAESVTDAAASVRGSAEAAYQFAGFPGSETVSVSDAVVVSTADFDGDTTIGEISGSTGNARVQGLVGWTDSDTQGQAFIATTQVDAETEAIRVMTQHGLPDAAADASGNVALTFIYRPVSAPVFSFVGNAGGSTHAEAAFAQGQGLIGAEGTKGSLGIAGAQAGATPLAQAWIAGNASVIGVRDFSGDASGSAVNPATFEESASDPDPSMTVGTQHGEFSAAMGSSSSVNASAESTVSISPDEVNRDYTNLVIATAFGFAEAARDYDNEVTAGTPPITLYDLDSEHAFVGQGSLVQTNVPENPDNEVSVTSDTRNLYGSAASPSFFGNIGNGDSSADVTLDDNGVYQRAGSASADTLSGANYPNAIAHNQMFVEGEPNSENSPWLELPWWWQDEDIQTMLTSIDYDHMAVGFIGAGGN